MNFHIYNKNTDGAIDYVGEAILAGADKLREHQSTTTAGHAGR